MFGALTSRLSARHARPMLGSVTKRVVTSFNATATRSFSFSPPRLDPAAKARATKLNASESLGNRLKAKGVPKSVASKTTPKKKPVVKKKKAPAKKVVAAAKKPAARRPTKKVAKKAEKPKAIKILPEHKPPSAPGGPFVLFCNKYVQGADVSQVEDKRAEMLRVVSEAARVWRSLSDHEKQAFKDEYKVAFEEYAKRRDEYFKNVDPAVLKQLNKLRVQKGKTKLHIPASVKVRQPPTPFVLFFNAERLRNPRSPSGAEGWRGWMRDLAVQWNGMSEAEKQPYRDQYVELRKAYLAAKA